MSTMICPRNDLFQLLQITFFSDANFSMIYLKEVVAQRCSVEKGVQLY